MDNSKYYILLIGIIVIFESIAQYHINESKRRNSVIFFLLAIASYSVICVLLGTCYSLKGAGVGITNFIWSILSIVSLISLGVIVFHETITFYDIFGIILCILGLYFIFLKDH